MDIFRSDLNAGFKNKLFETEIEHVNDRNIVLENNTLFVNSHPAKLWF